ncbi:ArnT family glycosyltransferase [Prosthecobacter sp.]|uniref:ArnT family glycosyltransferase n=1 Tax=Prosthecobacter sp. TaxID=1965333 RepID=UPI003783C57A
MSNSSNTLQPGEGASCRQLLLVLAFSFLFALGVAVGGGGFSSDLGGDPDEAAHAVTALMLRDYLADGLGSHPMTFAKAYYADFPRVALGHYPPLYYVLNAPLLLAHNSVSTLLVFQSLTLSLLAALTFHIGRHFLKTAPAAAASLCMLLLPQTLKMTQHVMADVLLALFCLWAALLWAWYIKAPSVRRALLWGTVAAAAILTKGSGMGLCLLPPLGTLLTGRWRLVFSWSWWFAALPVAVLAGPWMLYSTGISKEGMTLLSPTQYLMQAVPFYLKGMPVIFGWPLSLLAAAGAGLCLLSGWKKRALDPLLASLFAMCAGMTLVLLLVPVGLSVRYMLTLSPLVMLMAAYGLARVPWPAKLAYSATPLLLLVFSLLPVLTADIWPTKDVRGFSATVSRSGMPNRGEAKQNWLVASDPRGEGAVIAAAAFGSQQRFPANLRIYRGSKELATSDWMGRGYKAAFTKEADLLDHLDKLHVTRVFLDLSEPEDRRQPHEVQLLNAMNSASQRWRLDFEQPVTRVSWETGLMRVYQRTSANSHN